MVNGADPEFVTPETAERRRRQAEAWRKRSARVQRWRRILPIAIVTVIALLGLWVGGRGMIARLMEPKTGDGSTVRMVNPRFYGADAQSRAFVVAAKSAERPRLGGAAVKLEGPALTLDADSDSPTRVQAGSGLYHERQRTIDLRGGVTVNTQDYRLVTPKAHIDTRAGRVAGSEGVKATGPLGTVAASSYGVYDRGERIVFKGGVRAHIEQ
ncbi:MAG: LPS export ABC transporter periplasmic protein LptC [Caulobacteraceae bacterium]